MLIATLVVTQASAQVPPGSLPSPVPTAGAGTGTGTPPSEKPPEIKAIGDKQSCIKQITPDLAVTGAEFGFIKTDDQGKTVFMNNLTVPLIVEMGFGWRLSLRSSRRFIHWQEVFINPVPPLTWGVGPSVVISADRTTATTKEIAAISYNGAIDNYWYFLPGDPMGRYILKISIENMPVCTFEFDVVPP